MDKPFLLDKSAGEMFKFIVDSGENDQLSQVLKSMVSDRQQINKEADILQGSIKSTEDMIESYNIKLEKSKDILTSANNLMDYKVKYDEYNQILNLISEYSNTQKNILETDQKLEKINNYIQLYNSIDISNNTNNLITISNFIKEYKSIDLDTHNKEELLKTYSNNIKLLEEINISDFNQINQLYNDYITYLTKYKDTSDLILKSSNILSDEGLIINLSKIIDIDNIENSIKDLDNDLYKTNLKLNKISVEQETLNNIESKVEICPLCGQKIGGIHC